MKSIKEKAIEVFDDPFKQECFKAGANYVLEQVDYILMDKDLDCEETCDRLFVLIEQLKK